MTARLRVLRRRSATLVVLATLSVVTGLCSWQAAAAPLDLALGADLGWLWRSDYGDSSRGYRVPEIFIAGRHALGHRLSFRPAVRLGYVGLGQPVMPSSLRMREDDLTLGAEAGLTYDAVIVPSLVLGAMVVSRLTTVAVAPPVAVTGAGLGGFDLYAGPYVQAGVAAKLWGGAVMVGPFARFASVYRDARAHWRFGVEASWRLSPAAE